LCDVRNEKREQDTGGKEAMSRPGRGPGPPGKNLLRGKSHEKISP